MQIFVSCATAEFGGYRSRLHHDLGSSALHWVTQEQFTGSRFDTLVKLDNEIQQCSAMIHVIGRGAGSTAQDLAVSELLQNPPTRSLGEQLIAAIKPICDVTNEKLTYTHWEVLLAKFRGLVIFVFDGGERISDGHPADKSPFQPNPEDPRQMKAHRRRLVHLRRYAEDFSDYDSLKNAIFRTFMADASGEIWRLSGELKAMAKRKNSKRKSSTPDHFDSARTR